MLFSFVLVLYGRCAQKVVYAYIRENCRFIIFIIIFTQHILEQLMDSRCMFYRMNVHA